LIALAWFTNSLGTFDACSECPSASHLATYSVYRFGASIVPLVSRSMTILFKGLGPSRAQSSLVAALRRALTWSSLLFCSQVQSFLIAIERVTSVAAHYVFSF